MAESL